MKEVLLLSPHKQNYHPNLEDVNPELSAHSIGKLRGRPAVMLGARTIQDVYETILKAGQIPGGLGEDTMSKTREYKNSYSAQPFYT